MRGAQGKLCDLVGVRRRHPQVFAFLSAPIDTLSTRLRSYACSLSVNKLGPQGGAAVAESLKGNSKLQSLELAARRSNQLPSVRLSVSAH